jgi:hypothetical protein
LFERLRPRAAPEEIAILFQLFEGDGGFDQAQIRIFEAKVQPPGCIGNIRQKSIAVVGRGGGAPGGTGAIPLRRW